MTFYKHKITLLCLFLSLAAAAIPVKKPLMTVTQPDGTTFVLRCAGDEFYRLLTTEDGCAVVRNGDGTYCYASFDNHGFRHATPYAVGAADIPQEIIRGSRNIPYDLILRNARLRKERVPRKGPNLEQRIRALHPATRAAVTPRHGIIILAQFADEDFHFRYNREDFVNLLNGDGGKSAIDYFNDQFHGAYDFRFTVSNIVTLPRKHDYYGKNNAEDDDENATQMIYDACLLADKDIDFSLFDDDRDGEVDNVFVFFAGKDEADDPDKNADCIWSHAYYLSGDHISLTLDGVRIDRYACTSELMALFYGGRYTLSSIGTFCHEYSHTFGLADLYDTDYEGSGGRAEGLWGSLALMDSGNQNDNGYTPPYYNAIDRYMLGITDPIPLTPGSYTLEPIHINGTYFIMETDTEGEYYLFECRSKEGWDSGIGGSGLLIYHIDQSASPAGYSERYSQNFTALERWEWNEVNTRPDRQCADLVEADPAVEYDPYNKQVANVFWPRTNSTEFSPLTDPAFTFWSGKESTLALTGITRVGNAITFTVVGGVFERPPEALLDKQDIFQNAAIIQWSASDAEYMKDGFIRYNTGSGEVEHTVAPYAPGKYAFVIEKLLPRTAYKASIFFKNSGVAGKINDECRFTTKSQYNGSIPYIHVTNAERTEDGAFVKGTKIPLRVYNAADADGVSWTFNGEPVSPGGDGYFTVNASGVLRADIANRNGSHDLITKQITVR